MYRCIPLTAALVAAVLASGGAADPAGGAAIAIPDAHRGGGAAEQTLLARSDGVLRSLAVWDGARWITWWTHGEAPQRWRHADPRVARAVQWSAVRPGIDLGTVRFSGPGEAWRFAVVLLRIDPARHALSLHVNRAVGGRSLPWSVDELPDGASFGVNAGMFDALGPWGWLVLDGAERQPPGSGPLSSALVVGHGGGVRIVAADSIPAARAAGARWAVQSYPTALTGDGEIPRALRSPGAGVDLEHRDARLAIGTMRDGRVLVALTRFDALGGALGGIPMGPTLPEMTAILGALGAGQAMFLDGGISAQLAVRNVAGSVQRWSGLRGVPLALVGTPR